MGYVQRVVLPGLIACLAGCADVATTPVSATYADGYAAPGESAKIVLHTRRSLSGHVQKVVVAGGNLLPAGTILFEGESGFGPYLSTPSRLGGWDIVKVFFIGDPSHPQSTVEVPVPPDTLSRGRTSLELRVTCLRATAAGTGEFDVEAPDEVLQVPITVVSSGWEWPMRLRDAAGRYLVCVAFLMLMLCLWEWKSGPLQRVPDWLMLGVSFGLLYLTLIFGSDPLSGILGIVQTGYRALIFIAVVFATALLGDRMKALAKRWRKGAD